jgi:tubulin polyglutamylase TTLL6/13
MPCGVLHPLGPCLTVASSLTSPDGRKFDLRIYALVTSCDPLRVLVYKEGLTRLCTAKYEAPCKDSLGSSAWAFAHLTNSSVNKKNKVRVDGR